MKFAQEINHVLKSLLKKNKGFIALHEPKFEKADKVFVNDCLDTGWVSTAGKYVDEFEKNISKYTGSKYCIAVSNGTSALHLSLLLAGVKPNDEVLVPSLTFVASVNAISYCTATPHFIDIESDNFGIDPDRLRTYLTQNTKTINNITYNKKTSKKITALVLTHLFGMCAYTKEIAKICREFSIPLIEDAAESLGSFENNKHCGITGKLGILSFNGNKIITTGGGGMIMTSNRSLADKAKHLSTTAKIKHPWNFFHTDIAYNYRLPNLNAALGIPQLERIENIILKKRNLAKKYQRAFEGIANITFLGERPGVRSNCWLNTILLDKSVEKFRDDILKITNQSGIMTRPVWTPIHKLPMYKKCPRMSLPMTNQFEKRIINLPSSYFLKV